MYLKEIEIKTYYFKVIDCK